MISDQGRSLTYHFLGVMKMLDLLKSLNIEEGHIKCEKCNGVGFIITDGNAKECDCRFPIYKKHLPLNYREATIDNIDYANLDKVKGIKEMIAYFQRTPLNKVKKGVYLQGDVGRGKTHLACAIFNNYLGQGDIRFIVVDDLIRKIKESFDDTNALFRVVRYMEADLLILDDLGAEKTTEFVEGELYNIINHRYNNKLPTIITSNIPWNELPDKYPMNGKRIASRVSEMCGSFNLNGKDYRAR